MSTTPSPTNSDRPYEAALRDALALRFSLDELRSLCLDLGVEYEELGGDTRSRKAQELVLCCQRDGRLAELAAAMQRVRPGLMLPPTPPLSPTPSAPDPTDPTPETVAEAVFRAVWARAGALIEHRAPSPLWAQVDWQRAGEVYTGKVKRLHGTTQVIGQPQAMSLDDLGTEVHLLNKPTAWRRFSVEELQKESASREQSERQEERRDGLDFVTHMGGSEERRWLFVLGKPGAGKTTFLKHVTLKLVQGELGGVQQVPLFVALKDLADSGQGITEFIAGQLAGCGFPQPLAMAEALLEAGQVIVLFDGLDEVPQSDEQQATLIKALKRFVEQYDANQYLVTCRTAASTYIFSGFRYVEIADFTATQVEQFAARWFRERPQIGKLFLGELASTKHRGLRELTRTPLLLAMLCLMYEEAGTFPPQRAHLYRELLEALLERWDKTKGVKRDALYGRLNVDERGALLAQVAYHTFQRGETFIPEASLVQEVVTWLAQSGHPSAGSREAAGVLRAIEAQHGILIERAQGVYSFVHLTFQEYYAARYLADFTATGPWHALRPHMPDPRWREVFLLTVGLLSNADSFFARWLDYLDGLVADEGVAGWFAWVTDHLADRYATSSLLDRCTWLFTGLLLSRFRDLAFSLTLSPALDNALDRTCTLASDLISHLRLDRDPAIDFDPDLDPNLNLGLDIELVLALESHLRHALDMPLDDEFCRDLDFARDLDRDLNLTSQLARDHALNRVLDFARALDIDLMLALFAAQGAVRWFEEAPLHFQEVVETAVARAKAASKELGSLQLQVALRGLTFPRQNASLAARKILATALEGIQQAHRASPSPELSTLGAFNRLADYLASTYLLVECLDVASVSNKATIEARLLRPPLVRER